MGKQIDAYSYGCGVIDAFNEMVSAGVKKLALSHPIASKEEKEDFILFAQENCAKYDTAYYIEEEVLITDLFPVSMCKNVCVLLFYRDHEVLETYLALKKRKREAIEKGKYDVCRHEIAVSFGELLSYRKEDIEQMIKKNKEKESW